jgi:hypothetical protein
VGLRARSYRPELQRPLQADIALVGQKNVRDKLLRVAIVQRKPGANEMSPVLLKIRVITAPPMAEAIGTTTGAADRELAERGQAPLPDLFCSII